ncbi:hypothetical protein H2201_007593 [Coniosporium apollinis]|uniref:Nuclear pore complex component n=1 Tax=Coniosporium apollinis TaxID=61459 RepID=A0ABQ9NLX4_9PEZI|nr:hypothetical protein H2201_007593 [Coniosporium apollinis]
MALRAAPLTPSAQATQTVQAPQISTPTGTWRHPRMDEINQRQHAATFNDQNIHTILWNISILAITFISAAFLPELPSYYFAKLSPYSDYAVLALRLILLCNALIALYPLFRRRDDFSDIPLTPSQRKLLGLEPSSTPATPGSQYITPPRYARSSTPRRGSGSGSRPRPASDSPLSGRGSPAGGMGNGSPFASTVSPLLQKAMGEGPTRRLSYGRDSPLGASSFGASGFGASGYGGPEVLGNIPGTPTPMGGGKGASVGLNSKWLYERGRRSPGGRSIYS